jgi:RNA polymerase sigma-70 factor, ECF subfamily
MGGRVPPPEQPGLQDDRYLVERAQQGARDAFATLVRRHQDRAFNLAYQMVRNREDALDIAQEAFARAYSSLSGFKGDAAFGTWLHRIVVNLAIDTLRRRRRGGEASYDDARGLPEEPEGGLPAPDDPATSLEAKQTRALLARGIAQLPPAQRAVLILREIEGLSYDEIARAVRCNLGTVMSRLFYARRKLQQALKAHLADLR